MVIFTKDLKLEQHTLQDWSKMSTSKKKLEKVTVEVPKKVEVNYNKMTTKDILIEILKTLKVLTNGK